MECAYCHIVGHHIRECAELAAKNNKRRPVPTQPQQLVPPATTLSKTLRNEPKPRNAFSALYSSDEEEEEGEIVEERRPIPSTVVFEPEEPEEPEEPSWSRGGFRGIQIAQQESEAIECFDCYDEQSVIDGLKSLQAFVDQFKGMSWADI